jgi:hypothetical protein
MTTKQIMLEMPEKNWVEMYYALESKHAYILGGAYEEDTTGWANRLNEIMEYVAGRLEEEGIHY